MRVIPILVVLTLIVALGVAFLRDRDSGPTNGALGGPSDSRALEPDAGHPGVELEGPVVEAADTASDRQAASTPKLAQPEETVEAAAAADESHVTGRVVDALGQPVSGADVEAAEGSGYSLFGGRPSRPTASTNSGADGRFELAVPARGEVELRFGADGFEPRKLDVVAVEGTVTEVSEVVLSPGIYVSGRVVDSRGEPVADARVLRERPLPPGVFAVGDFSSGRSEELTRTAADGTFQVARLGAGDWKLIVDHDAHPRTVEEGHGAQPGDRIVDLVVVLEDGLTIRGALAGVPEDAGVLVVRSRKVGDSNMRFGGFDALRFGESTRVADDGTFEIRGLEAGAQYELAAYTDGGRRDSARRSAVQSTTAGSNGLVLRHATGASVSLRVLDRASGAPIEGATVGAGFGYAGQRSETDANGTAIIEDLWPTDAGERLVVEVDADGYAGWRREDVEVVAGQVHDLGAVRLEARPEVVVRVTDASGQPIEGARVALKRERRRAPGGPGRGFAVRSVSMEIDAGGDEEPEIQFGPDAGTARTDAEGVARLESLPGRTVRVVVTADGYARWSSDIVDLPRTAGAEFDASLSGGGAVVVRVVDGTGQPKGGVAVEHRDPGARGRDHFFGGPPERSTAEGRVRFDNLAAGPQWFKLTERRSGGGAVFISVDDTEENPREGWTEVIVAEGGEHELVLEAPPVARLSGTVYEDGKPLAGAAIEVVDDEGSGFSGFGSALLFGGGTPTDGAGRFEMDDLDVGTTLLEVSHPDRAMSERVEIDLVEGPNQTRIDLSVSIVEGRVFDPLGEPVAGARIAVDRVSGEGGVERQVMVFAAVTADGDDGGGGAIRIGNEGPTVLSDEEGRFELRGVRPDTMLVVSAEKDGFQRAESEPFEVVPGALRRGVELVLDQGGTIVVTYDAGGMWLVNATQLDDEGEETGEQQTTAMHGGRARIEDVAPGRYRVSMTPLEQPGSEGELPAAPEPVEVVVTKAREVTAVIE